MDLTGNAAPPPEPPPPPRTPPPPVPRVPPTPHVPSERQPAQAFRGGDALVLRVSRRMLWVGSAAFPLHNITWVDAFKLKPDRRAAFARFLGVLAVTFVIYAALTYAQDGSSGVGRADDGTLAVVFVVPLVVFVVTVVFGRSRRVLAVETAGGSMVVVTLPSMEELRRIAGRIVDAIDNPAAEFTAVVQQFHSNSTNHYGPVVNMNGGRGNTGFKL